MTYKVDIEDPITSPHAWAARSLVHGVCLCLLLLDINSSHLAHYWLPALGQPGLTVALRQGWSICGCQYQAYGLSCNVLPTQSDKTHSVPKMACGPLEEANGLGCARHLVQTNM